MAARPLRADRYAGVDTFIDSKIKSIQEWCIAPRSQNLYFIMYEYSFITLCLSFYSVLSSTLVRLSCVFKFITAIICVNIFENRPEVSQDQLFAFILFYRIIANSQVHLIIYYVRRQDVILTKSQIRFLNKLRFMSSQKPSRSISNDEILQKYIAFNFLFQII